MNPQNLMTALSNAMQMYERRWRSYYSQSAPISPRARRSIQNMSDLADNPYIDSVDMNQIYRESMYGPRFGGRGHGGGRHRHGGGGRRPGRHWRRRGRGGWGRGRRYWRPTMVYPDFQQQQVVMLRNLAYKIQNLYARLPNKRAWAKSVPPYRKTLARFFQQFPLPMI